MIFILTSIQEDIELFFGVYTELFTVSDKSELSQADIRNLLSLLAHNQIAATQLIRRGLPPPDTSKSPAYCFSQLKQGTYLIWLKTKNEKNYRT